MQQLLGGPRAGLDADEVAATFSLRVGTKLRHGVNVLDGNDQIIPDAAISFSDGTVNWAARPPADVTGAKNEAAEVRQTASLEVAGPTALFLEGFRYQPYTEFYSPLRNWVRVNLMVGVALTPEVDDDGGIVRRRLQLADKTSRLKIPILEPVTMLAASNPVDWVTGSLAFLFGETAFDIPPTSVTSNAAKTWAADGSTTWLQIYNEALEICAYDQLTVNPDNGRYRSVPLTELAGRGPEVVYGPGYRKIQVAASLQPLLPQVFNVVRFVARKGPSLPSEGNGYRTVRNQSTGPGSIDRLGGDQRVTVVQVDAENQAELDELAEAEGQRYFAGGGLRFSGKIGPNPLHFDRDVAGIYHPRLGLVTPDDPWLVTSHSFVMRRKVAGPDDVLMPITLEKKVVLS